MLSKQSKTKIIALKISYSAIFGALAIVISLLKIEFPMPILFWLKFDFAEVPDLLAFYIGGLDVGIATTLIHYIILNLGTPVHPVIGPLAKFVAVLSMMIGIYLAGLLREKPGLTTQLTFAILFRVVLMTFMNIIIYYIFIPDVLQNLPKILKPYFGEIGTVEAAFILVLGLTGIFNAVHALITVIIANRIYIAAIKYLDLKI